MGRNVWPKLRSRAVQLRWQFNAEQGLLDSRQVAGSLGVHAKSSGMESGRSPFPIAQRGYIA